MAVRVPLLDLVGGLLLFLSRLDSLRMLPDEVEVAGEEGRVPEVQVQAPPVGRYLSTKVSGRSIRVMLFE